MKFYTKISLILLIPVNTALNGCIKEDQYPIVPHIEFERFASAVGTDGKDSLGTIIISYTDGDGNIGLNPEDTVEPLKYNFYLKFMQVINKQLVEVKPVNPNVNFNARIPMLTPTGRNKNIKGEITRSLDLYFARQILLSDTVAFEIYIKDRDLNESNVVQTPLFLISR